MKLGIIIGHTDAAKGAFSNTFNQSEYTWNSDMANLISAVSTPVEVKVFFRDNIGISGAYAASDAWGAKITTELHFNWAHSTSATGSGILYYPGSSNGRKFATHLFDRISTALQLGDWPRNSGGIVTPFQASGQQKRGMRSLSAGRAPATLIEPFFGSNPADCAVAAAQKNDLAEAIVRAAEDHLI